MILLKTLKLNNFLSHQESAINFKDNQKLLIDGNSGSGKSTVLEGIIWALYGEGRSSNQSLIRNGADKASVELTVTSPEGEVVITRTITNKGKHSLEILINGISHPLTGVRELQAWIERELTGASYLLFVNSVAYLQGGAETFVMQPASKRKELLLEIVKAVDFEMYYDKIKDKINDEDKELIKINESINIWNIWLSNAKTHIDNKDSISSEIEALKLEIETHEKNRESARIELSKESDRQNSLFIEIKNRQSLLDKENDIASRIASAYVLEEEAEKVANLPYTELVILEPLLASSENKLNEINTKIADAFSVNKKRSDMLLSKPIDIGFEQKIADIQAILSDPNKHNNCPAKDSCPYFKETADKLVVYTNELVRISKQYQEFKDSLNRWQVEFDALEEVTIDELQSLQSLAQNEVKTYRTEIDNTKTILRAQDALAGHRALLSQLSADKASNFAEIKAKDEIIRNLEASVNVVRVKELELQISIADTRIKEIKPKLETLIQEYGIIIKTEQEKPDIEEKIAKAEIFKKEKEQNIYKLSLLKDAFGSKGIKTIVIDYILPELEEKINEILAQMSEFRVILDTQQLKADGESNKEGLFITIINDMGEEMPFETYSGGEKLKIIVAITEALATLQKCGFRIYDETFSALDENSLENFVRVINILLEKFSQVLCISHLQDVKASFEDKILVTKHNGISTIN